MGPQRAVLGGGDACGHRHWGVELPMGPRNETLSWVGETHVDTARGAFGRVPWVGGTPPPGPNVEFPMGLRNAVL
eukprot:9120588-Pyramimonas_sp.AAC.1